MLWVSIFFILSNSVLDYVVPHIYPAVVEDHPPVSADHHPPCSGGDVHHDVHPGETSAHNEDSLLDKLFLGGMSVLTTVALEASKPAG